MIGKIFGKWLVLEESGRLNSSRQKYYICKCECGTLKEVVGASLRVGKSNACTPCATNSLDLNGKQFGDWIVIKKSDYKSRFGHIYYDCKCKCGITKNIRAFELKNNKTLACVKCTNLIKNKNHPCRICKCKDHSEINKVKCELLGFCKRCDKFCCINCSVDPNYHELIA